MWWACWGDFSGCLVCLLARNRNLFQFEIWQSCFSSSRLCLLQNSELWFPVNGIFSKRPMNMNKAICSVLDSALWLRETFFSVLWLFPSFDPQYHFPVLCLASQRGKFLLIKQWQLRWSLSLNTQTFLKSQCRSIKDGDSLELLEFYFASWESNSVKENRRNPEPQALSTFFFSVSWRLCVCYGS